MIEGLDTLFEETWQPGVSELRELLVEVLGGSYAEGRLVHQRGLRKSRVYRLCFDVNGDSRCLIAKRFDRQRAQREQMILRRWLPAVGLDGIGAKLIGVAAQSTGICVWHLYEDLGECRLGQDEQARLDNTTVKDGFVPYSQEISLSNQHVYSIIELLADLHSRFIDHPLLAECRVHGSAVDASSIRTNVNDAIRSLEAWKASLVKLSGEPLSPADDLLERLYQLQDELTDRMEALAKLGGPETLLHGDMDLKNSLLLKTGSGVEARLIDWDHAGVGQVSYDLSNFLVQFESQDRYRFLNHYIEVMCHSNWKGLSRSDWNQLFETAECVRLAVSVVWPALAARETRDQWAFQELSDIERWFDLLEPVLPDS